jgi:quercetin dioxygenase-like cupin family protein
VSYEIVNFECSFDVAPKRDAIQKLEQEILGMVQADMPLEHYFAQGLYARRLTIPKNCVLTGAIHKFEHINIVLKGDITVVTDDGVKRIRAPYVMVSKPGTKRAGFAHEETEWLTVHACEAKDATEAETLLVTNSFDDYERFLEDQQCHLRLPAQS